VQLHRIPPHAMQPVFGPRLNLFMPLRITIEVIPHGDESKKFLVAQVDTVNIGTGTSLYGDYSVTIRGPVIGGGVDEWSDYPRKIESVSRDNHFHQACETLLALRDVKTTTNLE